MDNLEQPPQYVDRHGELVQELPRNEALVRLWELVARYQSTRGASGFICPASLAAAADGVTLPHRFGFGCCRREEDGSVPA